MKERKDLVGLGNMISNEIASSGCMAEIYNYRPEGYSPPPRLMARLLELFEHKVWFNLADDNKNWQLRLFEFLDNQCTPQSKIDILVWSIHYIKKIHSDYEKNDSPDPATDAIVISGRCRLEALTIILKHYADIKDDLDVPNIELISGAPELTLDQIRNMKNEAWENIQMSTVVDHFLKFTQLQKNSQSPHLTVDQLIGFLKKGFLGFKELPKQKFTFANGQKGKVIKHFHEFYKICTDKGYKMKMEPFKNLIIECFSNWENTKEITHQFKSRNC